MRASQQAFGKYLVVKWRNTVSGSTAHKAFDFSVLGNTPITYPIEWESSKIPGYAIRATVPNFHGLTAFVVMSSVAARFFGPQVAGIGAGPGGDVVFRIDHDENFNQTTHLQYQPWQTGPWFSFNWRYDSGLVAGPAPCAGGDCNNGPIIPETTSSTFSGLTPRSADFRPGFFCGAVLPLRACRSARPASRLRHPNTDRSSASLPGAGHGETMTITRPE